jgi:hypothetical protein
MRVSRQTEPFAFWANVIGFATVIVFWATLCVCICIFMR